MRRSRGWCVCPPCSYHHITSILRSPQSTHLVHCRGNFTITAFSLAYSFGGYRHLPCSPSVDGDNGDRGPMPDALSVRGAQGILAEKKSYGFRPIITTVEDVRSDLASHPPNSVKIIDLVASPLIRLSRWGFLSAVGKSTLTATCQQPIARTLSSRASLESTSYHCSSPDRTCRSDRTSPELPNLDPLFWTLPVRILVLPGCDSRTGSRTARKLSTSHSIDRGHLDIVVLFVRRSSLDSLYHFWLSISMQWTIHVLA